MRVTGPDFLALQVRDLNRAADFFETHLGPFGRTFTFTDPDGYAVTVHDRS